MFFTHTQNTQETNYPYFKLLKFSQRPTTIDFQKKQQVNNISSTPLNYHFSLFIKITSRYKFDEKSNSLDVTLCELVRGVKLKINKSINI